MPKTSNAKKGGAKFMMARQSIPKSVMTIALIAVVAVIAAVLYLSYANYWPGIPGITDTNGGGGGGGTTTTYPGPGGNCYDMQIDITSIISASQYQRYGITRPAPDGYRFVVMEMTVTNVGGTRKDFSGYRLELLADSTEHSPLTFNGIEGLSLLSGATVDYSCDELPLAYIGRFELERGESQKGCKIFQVLKDADPVSLSVYDLNGLKCTIEV